MHTILLILSLFTLQTTSLFILVPLYTYPSTKGAAWSNITASIAANSHIQYQVVINPDSGPGTTSPPTDKNLIAGVAKINSYANAITLGYVDTKFTQIPYSTLTSQIDAYAKWSSYTAANISINGIFFDDVNNTASSTVYSYYQKASTYAYAKIPSQVTPVIFNPGTPAPAQLFDYCDTILQYEDPLASYHSASTISTFQPGFNDQTAVVIIDTTSTANVKSYVHTMIQQGVEAVYFGVDHYYMVYSAALLFELTSAIAAG